MFKQQCKLNNSEHMPPSATLSTDVKFYLSVTKVNSTHYIQNNTQSRNLVLLQFSSTKALIKKTISGGKGWCLIHCNSPILTGMEIKKNQGGSTHTKQGIAVPAGSESTLVHITSHCQHNPAWRVVSQPLLFQNHVTVKKCAVTNILQTPMQVHMCVYVCKRNGCLAGQSSRLLTSATQAIRKDSGC